ncbi:MAG: DUF2262 domain-containing protein [Ruminococcus flavefaciens]|nr:DUF2262 domain-containing protein [Ruminococcus flavefaciens]MCM1228587.1 DUF2262 domain-containing protein [Ruminococcus flavefaciens]
MDRIYDKILGEMVYDEEYEWFNGNVNWCGNDVVFYMNIDNIDETVLNNTIAIAVDMVKNQQEWDDTVRKYAAKYLTDLANDWAYDAYDEDDEESEEPPEITEQEFAERIGLCDISFYSDGRFTFWFSDDDMFAGHSVTVYGDIENGCTDTAIEG